MNEPDADFSTKRVQGRSFPAGNFRVVEIDPTKGSELLTEQLLSKDTDGYPICVIRGAVDREICSTIEANFWRLIAVSAETRPKDEVVAVAQIGAHQFGKSGHQYLSMAKSTEQLIAELFVGLTEQQVSSALFEDFMVSGLSRRGISFRAARAFGMQSSRCAARSWKVPGKYALLPHEDFSQLLSARADHFEISTIESVTAYNLCVANPGGSRLHVWNVDPSPSSKTELGLQGVGYPYPLDLLNGYEKLEVELGSGDAYFLRSNFVHAVVSTGVDGRITLGRFLGRLADVNTFVYWT